MTDINNLPKWYWHRQRDWKEAKHRGARLVDTKNWTMSVGSDYIHDGSYRDFKIVFVHRIRKPREDMTGWSKNCDYYIEYKRRTIKVPTIKWSTAYNHRWLMPYYQFQTKILRYMALGRLTRHI